VILLAVVDAAEFPVMGLPDEVEGCLFLDFRPKKSKMAWKQGKRK
jgi:hypothetical protein